MVRDLNVRHALGNLLGDFLKGRAGVLAVVDLQEVDVMLAIRQPLDACEVGGVGTNLGLCVVDAGAKRGVGRFTRGCLCNNALAQSRVSSLVSGIQRRIGVRAGLGLSGKLGVQRGVSRDAGLALVRDALCQLGVLRLKLADVGVNNLHCVVVVACGGQVGCLLVRVEREVDVFGRGHACLLSKGDGQR